MGSQVNVGAMATRDGLVVESKVVMIGEVHELLLTLWP